MRFSCLSQLESDVPRFVGPPTKLVNLFLLFTAHVLIAHAIRSTTQSTSRLWVEVMFSLRCLFIYIRNSSLKMFASISSYLGARTVFLFLPCQDMRVKNKTTDGRREMVRVEILNYKHKFQLLQMLRQSDHIYFIYLSRYILKLA